MKLCENDLKEFEQAVSIAKELIESKDIVVIINLPTDVGLQINKDKVVNRLSKTKFKEESFDLMLREISWITSAILDDAEEGLVKIATEDVEESQRDKQKKIIENKIQLVKSKIVDEHLRERHTLKLITKGHSFAGLSWDIKTKHFDSRKGPINNISYTSVQFSYQRAPVQAPLARRFMFSENIATITINFDTDELIYVIRGLEQAKQELQKLSKEGK